MRGIISWILFFSAGVFCAGACFYRLHPEHQPETDLPRVRQEMEEAIDRGKRLKRAWEGPDQAQSAPEPQPEKLPPQQPAEPRKTPPANTPTRQGRVSK
ncbi:MAG: hypothetical protein KF754_09870 [Planctomycetes bacterium]|nr:hypothetical protein [Planctomycetota bacterium]